MAAKWSLHDPRSRSRWAGEMASVVSSHSRLEAELEALLAAPLTFPGSFRLPLHSISQLALPILSFFDLLNLCFGSLFHTHSDSLLPPPQRPGTSARQRNQRKVKFSFRPSSYPHCLHPPPVATILLWDAGCSGSQKPLKCLSASFTRKHRALTDAGIVLILFISARACVSLK